MKQQTIDNIAEIFSDIADDATKAAESQHATETELLNEWKKRLASILSLAADLQKELGRM